ncbi:MAG: tetratricopeptide repeat protein [Planctomycetota bacterium]|nr:tetratricopeptide repeat protein [Planctomycetota bacterium]
MRLSSSFPHQLVPTLVLALAIACAQNVLAQDKIFPLKNGAEGIAASGKIVERTRDKVVIEKGGANQNFDTNQISRVVFEGEPVSLTQAKRLIREGNVDQAIEEFRKIDQSALKSDELKQDYAFYRGYISALNALRGKGDAAAATKVLMAWAKDNSTSHLFYMASEKLGELAIASGTPDQASKFFDILGKSPFDDFKVKGNYLSGKALFANKQIPEARAKYSLVGQSQVSDPVSLKFKKLASLAAIRCDAAEGKTPQAIEALEKMVDEGDSTDAELFSELFNALGGILRTAGNNDEAILAFLKTDLLYSTEQDAHAEALFNLAQLWSAVGENIRATEAKSRLAKLYPTSPWLNKK